jgi:hypothetical protein
VSNMKRMTRQAKWQHLKKSAGLCTICGKRKLYKYNFERCLRCLKKQRMRVRKSLGYKPWRKGGRGRVPAEARTQEKGTGQGA